MFSGLLGLVLLVTAWVLLWYVRPLEDGTVRYPLKYQRWVENALPMALIIIIVAGLALVIRGAIVMSVLD